MTRPTALGRRSPAGVIAAVLAGLAVGAVQAAVFAGYLGSTRPDTSEDQPDRGFGSNPSIYVEFLWILGFLLASIVLVTVALALLRIGWYALVMLFVLAIEFGLGAWIGSMLPGHSDWRALVLALVLAFELLVCRWALPRRAVASN